MMSTPALRARSCGPISTPPNTGAVVQGESDWAFGPDDRGIQREVLAGWAGAAQELGDLPPDDLTDWLTRRHAFVADGRARMRVGHTDVFARPTGTR